MSRGNLILAIIYVAISLVAAFSCTPDTWTEEDQARLERKSAAVDIMLREKEK